MAHLFFLIVVRIVTITATQNYCANEPFVTKLAM